ncbi:hypothetical protein [Flavobacterium eburneipallidum]|uniref:hypothetical protein n=1 Tax=Flavobacterium eburneipallidum TaxID=3003263 RepID=UPI002482F002|nr:hypothetical protein [Flavobacterium eburneipallidum]
MEKQIGADSSTQREIEKLIIEKITAEGNFTSQKKITIIKEVKFEFDFYNEEKKIIGEIYAGIDKINSAQKKKIITDCFKMVYAEKLLDCDCVKMLIFIDENIEKAFKGSSWASKAIEEYKIKTRVIKISEGDMKKLIATKELQQRSNQKKQS